MTAQEIIVDGKRGRVEVRDVLPAEDRSDAEVTASGDALDRMVAEIVMGLREGVDFGKWLEHEWSRLEDGSINLWDYISGEHIGPMCRRCGEWFCTPCVDKSEIPSLLAGPCSNPPPPYGSSLRYSLDVIDKLREHGYWCEMRSPWTTDAGAQWWAGFTPHATTGWNGRPDHWHSGDTLPEAVCRAAVAAMLERKAYEERERAAQMRDDALDGVTRKEFPA